LSKQKYNKAIGILTSQGRFHIKLGLERVEKILEYLGNPQKKLKFIHVAGTNGKGSVCAMLSAILSNIEPAPLEGEGQGGGYYKISRLYSKKTLEHAKCLRKNMTDAENILWYYLRKKQMCGFKFRKQSPIGSYIADFVCFEKKLIIELDGGQHLENNSIKYDEVRGNFLKKAGFDVLRFYNTDIFKNIESVLECIFLYLNPPTPNPPPQGGREQNFTPHNNNCFSINYNKQALRSSVLKVGLFTSPHVFEYTERIKINDAQIDKKTFAQEIIKITELAQKNNIALTEFEILTAVAFEYFAQNNVDLVILETGLGGRFDATNIIKKNICSIITSIDFDHTERLGDTIEKIAFEKAGIIKSGSFVLINKNNLGFEVIKKIAKEKRTQVLTADAGRNFPQENSALQGNYQKENLSLVLKTIEFLNKNGFKICKKDIQKGLEKFKHPCRFEFHTENILIDAAHNPSGAKALRKSLEKKFPNQNFRFIFGCLRNKNYPQMIENLFSPEDEIFFYQFDNPNSCSFEELNAVCPFAAKSFKKFNKSDKITVICGSIYMIKELLTKIDKK